MATNEGNQTTVWTDFSDDIAAAMGPAVAATQAAQTASHGWIVEYGAEVVGGHATVEGPSGSPPDSDVSGKDASDV